MNCQKCPEHVSFFFSGLFLKSSSRYSLARIFVDLIFQKWAETVIFYNLFSKNEVCILWAAFPNRPIEARTRGNRDPPAATADGHSTQKNRSFCAQECFQARTHVFPIAHTSQLLDDDDVVDIVMWLT